MALLVDLGILALVVVIARYLTNWLVGPLEQIARAAYALQTGDLNHRALSDGPDEICQLAVAFNQMAASLQKYYEELEQLVAQRTAALQASNAKLEQEITERKQGEEHIQALNRSLEEMVYVTSHDLQVPLVSMEAYASELLEEYTERFDDEGVYALTRLQANVRRMHALVLSLLDISRLNTKKYPHTEFEASEAVEHAIRDLELVIEQSHATIEVKNLPQMDGDKLRLTTVFRNVITNALVYGGTEIIIGYRDDYFYIQDNGIGIPTNQLDKIFAPTERLKMVDVEGVGMGLAFCQKVIQQHGGEIWAESEGQNMGSTFYFTLKPEKQQKG